VLAFLQQRLFPVFQAFDRFVVLVAVLVRDRELVVLVVEVLQLRMRVEAARQRALVALVGDRDRFRILPGARQAFSISGSLVPTVYSLMPSMLTSTWSVE
jgi:hypothetical protein